jgi:hypothetical protein
MVGQHIRALKGGRWIHAIDCGDETVLHLADEAAPQRVRRAYRPEFLAGSAAVEVITHRERTFPANEIVQRAYSRASDPALAAMFRDSEAFAEWCATGRLPGPRNVALEVPGLLPAASAAAPAAAPAAAAAPRKAPAPRKKARARRPAPARKAKVAKRVKTAKAKVGRAKARKATARKAKAPARRGAKAVRSARRSRR